jgi:hypothetical protein
MSHDRTHHIRTLTAIFLECRSVMASTGITASTAEVIDLVWLVALREAEARKMDFMTRERELTRERWLDELTVN